MLCIMIYRYLGLHDFYLFILRPHLEFVLVYKIPKQESIYKLYHRFHRHHILVFVDINAPYFTDNDHCFRFSEDMDSGR